MSLTQLLAKNRSYRRFDAGYALDEATLRDLVALARLCPSAANRQPLKFATSHTAERNAAIFGHLRWAGALPDWPGPEEAERPTGYILILGDTRIAARFPWDDGIVAQSILLGAVERGLGGCMIGSLDKDGLRRALCIPNHLEVLLVLALGRPVETVVLEDTPSPDEVPYWRDENQTHHVPKRPLEEILVDLSGFP